MTRRPIGIALVALFLAAPAVYAGMGYFMKCQAKPAKDPATGKTPPPCAYESRVIFGGGMMSDQLTGYCRKCKKFVHLHWTRDNIPEGLRGGVKPVPKPKPLGEVWDAKTGKVLTVHACPTCRGPFLEIKKREELKHCPKCNKPHFAVDPSKPLMAID